jgi:hypothetical protein
MKLGEFLASIQPGEVVLIEYRTLAPASVALLRTVEAFGEECTTVSVADMAMVFISSLQSAGVDIRKFDRVGLIKIGGRVEWKYPSLHLPMTSNPTVALEKLRGGIRKTAVVVGLERFLMVQGSIERAALSVVEFLSDELGGRRRWVILVNSDVAPREFLALMEDVATRVLSLDGRRAKVLRSISGEEGKGIRV